MEKSRADGENDLSEALAVAEEEKVKARPSIIMIPISSAWRTFRRILWPTR